MVEQKNGYHNQILVTIRLMTKLLVEYNGH